VVANLGKLTHDDDLIFLAVIAASGTIVMQ